MKKFGFSRKGDDGEDANRNALFSRKKSNPAAASDNPYAQQGGNDPYTDTQKYANVSPYQQARQDLNSGQRPAAPPSTGSYQSGGGGSGYGSSSPAPSNDRYGAPPSSGYGADKYGSGGGYGSNRYNNAPAPATRGPGGYGGFGRDTDADSNRDALFSGAEQRQAQKQPTTTGGGYGQGAPGTADPQDPTAGGAYGGYGEERELTAEEQEEQETQNILAEKRRLQQESASSVGRSVAMGQAANEVARATLARLGAQGERLHNTEKNLDIAANQNKVAQDRAAELKTLNRSMFAVHVGNPFTSKARQQRADEQVLERHRLERAEREETRKAGYAATQRMEQNFKELNQPGAMRPQARKKDYGKFNFADEEGADELEDQIDDGLNELGNQVSMLNMASRAIGKEVESQNGMIDRIGDKSDRVDDLTRMNRERLARFK